VRVCVCVCVCVRVCVRACVVCVCGGTLRTCFPDGSHELNVPGGGVEQMLSRGHHRRQLLIALCRLHHPLISEFQDRSHSRISHCWYVFVALQSIYKSIMSGRIALEESREKSRSTMKIVAFKEYKGGVKSQTMEARRQEVCEASQALRVPVYNVTPLVLLRTTIVIGSAPQSSSVLIGRIIGAQE
jgi:hypothetical protein